MRKPEITILILSFSQSTVSTPLLSLYEVRPHTELLAMYQLSRRLNMISLPTQLTWDELTRKCNLMEKKKKKKKNIKQQKKKKQYEMIQLHTRTNFQRYSF